MGVAELGALLCIIITIGHYFVMWAVYLERRLALVNNLKCLFMYTPCLRCLVRFLYFFPPYLQRKTTSVTTWLLSWTTRPFRNGVSFKKREWACLGRNSFLQELTQVKGVAFLLKINRYIFWGRNSAIFSFCIPAKMRSTHTGKKLLLGTLKGNNKPKVASLHLRVVTIFKDFPLRIDAIFKVQRNKQKK